MRTALYLLVPSFFLAAVLGAGAQQTTMTDEELMAQLKGSAPQSVVEHATIMNMDSADTMGMGSGDKMRVVQQGSNGWTCMYAAGVPMCADKAAVEWMEARKKKGPAPKRVGFIYMLKGDAGTSNTDPYATAETADNNWVKTGPHVMIVGPAKDMLDTYPRDAKPDPTTPYVMWPGTPYEHLMLPTE
jgi:hypothetical protein